MEGFRIVNDDRLWLKLDNENILGKSYNEIKAWAEQSGFRFATDADMEDLQDAIMPQGYISSYVCSPYSSEDVTKELHYTSDELIIIGSTYQGYKGWYYRTIGYTQTESNMPLKVTEYYYL